jgi:hypothetical protein
MRFPQTGGAGSLLASKVGSFLASAEVATAMARVFPHSCLNAAIGWSFDLTRGTPEHAAALKDHHRSQCRAQPNPGA